MQPTAFGTVSAVLTDFDRTLTRLFPSPALERTVSADLLEFYEAQGLQIAALSDEDDPYALWTTAYRWMRAQPGPVHCEALTRQAAARLTAHEVEAAGSAQLLEGVEETLRWLSARAIPIIVVSTNSTRAIWRALQATGVAETVDHVFARADDFRMEDLKPSGTLLNAAITATGGDGHQALFVGDSPTDMVAGRRAGVVAVGVTTGTATKQELMEAGADHCIESFASLRQCGVG